MIINETNHFVLKGVLSKQGTLNVFEKKTKFKSKSSLIKITNHTVII